MSPLPQDLRPTKKQGITHRVIPLGWQDTPENLQRAVLQRPAGHLAREQCRKFRCLLFPLSALEKALSCPQDDNRERDLIAFPYPQAISRLLKTHKPSYSLFCIQSVTVPWIQGKEITAVLNQAGIIHPMSLQGAK